MSARERLVVIFAGRDPRSGAAIPPAVPIGELLDSLDATARTEDGEPVRSKIITRHPLQPFDRPTSLPAGSGSPPVSVSISPVCERYTPLSGSVGQPCRSSTASPCRNATTTAWSA